MVDSANTVEPREEGAYLRRGVQIVVAALAVLLLCFLVDLRGVLASLLEISLQDIGILVALSAVLSAVSVLKWSLFLRHLGISARLGRLTRLYLVGYFINIFTPSFIGGDVVRSLYIGRSVDRAHAVSATFLERYTGIVAMLAMSLAAVWMTGAITLQIRVVVISMVLGCVVATWLIFSGAITKMLRRLGTPERLLSILDRVHDGLAWGLSDRALFLKALGLSIVFHLLTVVNTVAVALAVGWYDAPWSGLMVVVPLILLVGAVPISPQGLGIQEGAFVFFLHSVGASTEQALAVALVLRAKSYALALLGGALAIGLRGSSNESAPLRAPRDLTGT